MESLLLAILSSAAIIVVFKVCERYSRDVLVLICYNYLAAFILSILSNSRNQSVFELNTNMILPAIITGGLFIAVFFIISLSSKYAGVAKTTIAGKMSFVIPVIFSIVYWNEGLGLYKAIGLVLAFISILMVVYRSRGGKVNLKGVFYPVLLFFGAGLVDSAVKYIQQTFLTQGGEEIFTLIVFGVASLISLLVIVGSGGVKRLLSLNRLIGGVLLGIVNYGSLYYLIKSLNSNIFDSSIVFCIINTGIVLLNVIVGIFIFGERISLLNKVGVFLVIVALLTLTVL